MRTHNFCVKLGIPWANKISRWTVDIGDFQARWLVDVHPVRRTRDHEKNVAKPVLARRNVNDSLETDVKLNKSNASASALRAHIWG